MSHKKLFIILSLIVSTNLTIYGCASATSTDNSDEILMPTTVIEETLAENSYETDELSLSEGISETRVEILYGESIQIKTIVPTTATIPMTESYAQGRELYQEVTGLLLPELANIDATFYGGTKEGYVCFHLVADKESYLTMVTFFEDYFSCEPYRSTEVDHIWNKNGFSYQIFWDGANEGVYINYFQSH